MARAAHFAACGMTKPDKKYGDEGVLWNLINARIREIVREEIAAYQKARSEAWSKAIADIRGVMRAADPPLAHPDEGIIKGFAINPKLVRKKK